MVLPYSTSQKQTAMDMIVLSVGQVDKVIFLDLPWCILHI